MKLPCPFEGKHNDIEHFLGACTQYFKTFRRHYQGMHSLMVGFAVSLLKGEAEDWWVDHRDLYWYVPHDPRLYGTPKEDTDFEVGPCYRYPTWDTFTDIFRDQFRDPAIELVHEKRMCEVKMGSDPTYTFFQKLEREAKLANRLTNQMDQGLLVQAVRRGIPPSYGSAIANIGFAIPHTYEEWKRRITIMYEEKQKQKVFEQTQRIKRFPHKQGGTSQKATDAKSSNTKTAKPTNSARAKGGPNSKPRNTAGQWMTHLGQGVPMDIDAKKARQ